MELDLDILKFVCFVELGILSLFSMGLGLLTLLIN